MTFFQLYANFPKVLLETLGSPFSGRKRKREQADPTDDSLSTRPTKTAAQPSNDRANAPSHQSNTRAPAAIVQKPQGSLGLPTPPDREATSETAQGVCKDRTAEQRGSGDLLTQQPPQAHSHASSPCPSESVHAGLREL